MMLPDNTEIWSEKIQGGQKRAILANVNFRYVIARPSVCRLM